MTPAEMVRYHERRATKAEALLRSLAAIHSPEGRRKQRCSECGQPFPCRTSQIAAEQ